MNPVTIKKIRQGFFKSELDAILISKEANVSYLSGFRGEGHLLISPTKKILIVDFRFKEQAAKEAKSFQICQRQSFDRLEKSILHLVNRLKIRKLGFEGSWVSYEFYRKLKNALGSAKIVSTINIIERLRAIKSTQEIKLLKKAASLALKSYTFAKKTIKPGKKESQIARDVQYFMKKSGAQDSAFEIIIASGKRSSMPHALVSHKIIKDKDAVLVDLGCRMSDYNSDLTRMVFLGKIRGKIKRIYEVVFQAQQMAIKAVKAGTRICEIDKIARQYIAKCGLDAFFGHALGHGIGREVHEYPSISPNSKDILKEGMVFTIEPGVYIPGVGGVRVEDMVLVTKKGCEILTKR
ncbi:MAG: aminopeptidase P family protein [Candidatus Omnitrophica bacterium]|nr:aminopeptidase P family protein [Candidatus Omnitrophota bacterium]